MTINDPEIVQELRELYPAYEHALVGNDIATLARLFWSSSFATRFGVGENLYGSHEIEAFRQSRPASQLARKVNRLEIVSFGRDYASITVEFERESSGKLIFGRQSQVWVRLPEGWRIVSAHVSLLPSS